jgi:hypothetical protein
MRFPLLRSCVACQNSADDYVILRADLVNMDVLDRLRAWLSDSSGELPHCEGVCGLIFLGVHLL